MRFVILFLLSFAIGWGGLQADQHNPELPDLVSQLEQAGTSYTASPIVQNIWAIWLKHPNSQLTQAMQAASEIMQNGDLEQAELLFTQLIEKAPGGNFSNFCNIMPGSAQAIHIINTSSLNPFDDQHLSGAMFKIDPWDIGSLIRR